MTSPQMSQSYDAEVDEILCILRNILTVGSVPGAAVQDNASIGSSSRLGAHDQHRTGSVPDDFLGDAAEQRSRHAGASVARDDDEVGGPFFCLLDNCRAWDTRLHKFMRGGWQRKAIAETTEQSLALLFSSSIFRRGIVDIDEADFTAERAAKI